MKKSEFRKLSGWVDYDRPSLHLLSKAQEIAYFKKRLNMVLLTPLQELYKSLAKGKRKSSTVLCFGTCVCCAIEALGKFYTGILERGNAGNSFEAWIAKYMDKDFSQKFGGTTYKKLLWDNFRNGLAHGFTIKKGGFEHHTNYFHTKTIGGVKQLEIDPKHFYVDFVKSIETYVSELEGASLSDNIYLRFSHAFRGIFILGL